MHYDIPKYVESVVSKILCEWDVRDYKIEVTAGMNDGDGFSSVMLRLKITGYNKENQNVVIMLMCKILPEDQNVIDKFHIYERFEREIFFYNQVLPEFEKIQRENNIVDRDEGFYAYPKCYHASYNRSLNQGLIVLEDLAAENYKMHESSNYVVQDVDQMRELLKQLGRFHAISFALRKLKPEIWNKFIGLNDLLVKLMSTDFMTFLANKNIKLAQTVIDPNDKLKSEELKNLEIGMWNKMAILLDSKISEPFSVINHGDCWFNNVMFLYEVS